MSSTIFETGTLRAEAACGVRGGRLKPERSVAISLLVSRATSTPWTVRLGDDCVTRAQSVATCICEQRVRNRCRLWSTPSSTDAATSGHDRSTHRSHDHTQHSRCTLYTSRAKQLCLQQTRATVQHLCISPRHDNTVVAQWHTDARITTAMAAYVPGGADSDALQLEQHVS
jgi:hypothetical protein